MKPKLTPSEINDTLQNFSGSEQFHRWSPLYRKHLLTEGTNWLADEVGAFWLMDLIASHQHEIKDQDFQVWKMTKDKQGDGALVVADDGNGNEIATQKLEFTDFPLEEITLWAERNEFGGFTIMLPGER